MFVNWFGFRQKSLVRPPVGTPSPQRPATPPAVGTQDSPVLAGQKPGQIPAPVQAQAGKKRRAVGWWENDWANIARTIATTRTKHEQINADLPGAARVSVKTP